MFLTDLFKKNYTQTQPDAHSENIIGCQCPVCRNMEKSMIRNDGSGTTIITCAICHHEFSKI
jgi:hypothetical protein